MRIEESTCHLQQLGADVENTWVERSVRVAMTESFVLSVCLSRSLCFDHGAKNIDFY